MLNNHQEPCDDIQTKDSFNEQQDVDNGNCDAESNQIHEKSSEIVKHVQAEEQEQHVPELVLPQIDEDTDTQSDAGSWLVFEHDDQDWISVDDDWNMF